MKRRSLAAQLVGGLGEGLASFGSQMLGNNLQQKRQDKAAQAALLKEQLDAFNTEVKGISDPKMVAEVGPERSSARYDALRRRLPTSLNPYLGASPDFNSLDSSTEEKMAPVMDDITKADKAEAVPSSEALKMGLQRRRVPTSTIPRKEQSFAMAGDMAVPSNTGEMVTTDSDELTRMVTEADRKRKDLEAGSPRSPVQDFSSGSGVTTYKTNRELASQGPVASERTPGQEAGRQGAIRTATEQASQTVLNDPRNVKGFASREAAAAFARQQAGNRADQQAGAGSFAKDISIKEETGIDGKLVYRVFTGNKQTGTVDGGSTIESDNFKGETSDAERKARGYADRGTTAHNKMLMLEDKLRGRGYVFNLAMLNAPDAIKDPLSRQYMQEMRVFINDALGRPQSGGAITPDEIKTYGLSSAFGAGIDEETLSQVQNSRREALQSLKLQAGPRLGNVFVTMAELAKTAELAGTTLDQELAEAEASGYKVVR